MAAGRTSRQREMSIAERDVQAHGSHPVALRSWSSDLDPPPSALLARRSASLACCNFAPEVKMRNNWRCSKLSCLEIDPSSTAVAIAVIFALIRAWRYTLYRRESTRATTAKAITAKQAQITCNTHKSQTICPPSSPVRTDRKRKASGKHSAHMLMPTESAYKPA